MNKTVIVTGALGFVGSHTVKYFKSLGYKVIGIDRDSTIPEATKWVDHWFCKDFINTISMAMYRHHADTIVHCAGTSLVGPSIADPGEYYDNNVAKTNRMLNILAVDLDWHGNFIFSSSAAVYGQPEQIPIPEHHSKLPVSPYGYSKLFTEQIIADHCAAHGIRGIALRYFNAAGADPDRELGHVEDDTHLIPRIFSNYFENTPITINGQDFSTPDGTCVRDYIHVLDIARAHHAAALLADSFESGSFQAYNIGTGTGYSNLEVLTACKKYLGARISHQFGERRAGDPAILVADSLEFQKIANWRPEYSDIDKLVSTAGAWHQKKYVKNV